MTANDQLLTTEEAAKRCGVAPATMQWWRWKGITDQPPAVKLGTRRVRYRASDIDAWIAGRQPKTKQP